MNERYTLLQSVANTISTYRHGELEQPTPEHVGRWLEQFTPENQLPFIREFDHVLKQTFITEANIWQFLNSLVTFEDLVGNDSREFWLSANFLDIQSNGHSQSEMIKCFSSCLMYSFGFSTSECGKMGGDYIYLDDIMFSGGRVSNDLKNWIKTSAPQQAKVHVIVAAKHSLGMFLSERHLNQAIDESGKSIEIEFWSSCTLENTLANRNNSQVLWPSRVPNDDIVQRYINQPHKYPLELRLPTQTTVFPFSSEEGRAVLESEFLIAGAKILSRAENPKASLRPLGYSGFGVGFGSMLVTYRNCPNNCPLAMWWGDSSTNSGALSWYPLLAREGYSHLRLGRIFNAL